ncbi:MAG TPA: hypothetical protein VGQ82_11800 [Chthoniobacterales bacterium]|nr:hypothetical protein [Chthoniobacterales bacterium]
MRKTTPLVILCGCALFLSATAGYARNVAAAELFTFKDAKGKTISAPLAGVAEKRKLTSPSAHVDPALDPKLTRAATIAQEHANAHSKSRCWHYVKDALVASGVVASRPTTALAKQAGDELVRNYGFKKLPISDPFAAPVGAVLVYNAPGSAGHVEIRTEDGFASDFRAKTPSRRPLIGIYGKA